MYKTGLRNYVFCAYGAACSLGLLTIGSGLRANAQTAAADLSFEAATVKPVDPAYHFDGTRFGPHVHPASASYWYMTPNYLVSYAYDVESFQVRGPEWTNVDRFDIEARFPEGADKKDERRMLQALLKERFGLAYHTEERELEGYVLVVGRHGAKLTPSVQHAVKPETDAASQRGDNNAEGGHTRPKAIVNKDGSSTIDMGERGTQTVRFDQAQQAMRFEVSKMTMQELAGRLKNCVGSGIHKVEDETGLKGSYELAYECPNPTVQTSSTDADGVLSDDRQGSSSLTRSLDAHGLKLEKRKFLQKIYVIDRMERPSEN